jgi:hypothetical protein
MVRRNAFRRGIARAQQTGMITAIVMLAASGLLLRVTFDE